jgi:hypothetical protein
MADLLLKTTASSCGTGAGLSRSLHAGRVYYEENGVSKQSRPSAVPLYNDGKQIFDHAENIVYKGQVATYSAGFALWTRSMK